MINYKFYATQISLSKIAIIS